MSTESLHEAWATLRFSTWQTQYAAVGALLVVPFIITYLLTSIRAAWKRSVGIKNGPQEPPIAPYAVPGLAHTFQFAVNTEGFLWRML